MRKAGTGSDTGDIGKTKRFGSKAIAEIAAILAWVAKTAKKNAESRRRREADRNRSGKIADLDRRSDRRSDEKYCQPKIRNRRSYLLTCLYHAADSIAASAIPPEAKMLMLMNRSSSTCADNHRGEKHGISKKRSHFLHLLRQKDDVRDICRQLSIPCSLPFLPQTVWLFCTVQSSGRSDLSGVAKIAIATLAFSNADSRIPQTA